MQEVTSSRNLEKAAFKLKSELKQGKNTAHL